MTGEGSGQVCASGDGYTGAVNGGNDREEWKMAMQKAQFERIFRQMAREFGEMTKGNEADYAMLMFPMEANALKVHRAYPQSNSRRMKEAVGLVLYGIRDRCTGQVTDVGRFRNANTERLEKALLAAFDPYANEEIMESIGQHFKSEDLSPDELRDYYRLPVWCLLRIKDSIDRWEQNLGSNGYFIFIESYMGEKITGKDMEYSVLLLEPPEL